jgi:hypothetical protein
MKKSNRNTSTDNWLKKLAKNIPAASMPMDRVFKTYPTTLREDYGYNKGKEIGRELGIEQGRIQGAESTSDQFYELLEQLENKRLARENELKKILAEKSTEFENARLARENEFEKILAEKITEFENARSARENELKKILEEKSNEFANKLSTRENELKKILEEKSNEFANKLSTRENELNELKKILAEKDAVKSVKVPSATDQLLEQIEQFGEESSIRENELKRLNEVNKILAEKNTTQKTEPNKLNKILSEKGPKQDKQNLKGLFTNLTQKLRENPNYVDYGSTALGAGVGGLIGANLFKTEEEEEEGKPSLLGGALGAVGGAGLGYGAGRAINHYLSKKSAELDKAFERGFVKRAAEHGFSAREAVELLTK